MKDEPAGDLPEARELPGPGRFRNLRPLPTLLAVAAGLALGYLAYGRVTAAPPAPAPAQTLTVPIDRGQIASVVSAAGSVVATKQARLSFNLGGRLKEVLVELGQTVQAGDTLARLETAQLEIRVEQARSSLRSAQLKLDQLKVGPRPEEVAAAQAAVDSAQARYDEVLAGATAADLKSAEQPVTAAQATLEKARNDLAKLKAGLSEEELTVAKTTLEKSAIALQKAQADYDRISWRNDIGMTPQAAALQQATLDFQSAQANYNLKTAPAKAEDLSAARRSVDAAEASLQSAQARLDQLRAGARASEIESARNSLASAKAQLALKTSGPTDLDVAVVQESIKQAELSLRQAETDLANATLVAPFVGVIASVGPNPGEQIGAGTVVVTLVDPNSLRIDVTIDEMDIAKVSPGKPALISFDALPDLPFTGRVIAVAPSASVQQGVVSYLVSIALDRPTPGSGAAQSGSAQSPAPAGDGQAVTVPAGLTASASIISEQKDDVLMIPNRALRTVGRDRVVEVMVDGKPEVRPVRTGVSNDQFTEALEGLEEGDLVVVPSTTTSGRSGLPQISFGSRGQ